MVCLQTILVPTAAYLRGAKACAHIASHFLHASGASGIYLRHISTEKMCARYAYALSVFQLYKPRPFVLAYSTYRTKCCAVRLFLLGLCA